MNFGNNFPLPFWSRLGVDLRKGIIRQQSENRWAKFPELTTGKQVRNHSFCCTLLVSLAVSVVVPVVSDVRTYLQAKVLKHPSVVRESNSRYWKKPPSSLYNFIPESPKSSRSSVCLVCCVNFVTQTPSHHFTLDAWAGPMPELQWDKKWATEKNFFQIISAKIHFKLSELWLWGKLFFVSLEASKSTTFSSFCAVLRL